MGPFRPTLTRIDLINWINSPWILFISRSQDQPHLSYTVGAIIIWSLVDFVGYHKCQFVLKSLLTLLSYNSHYSSTRHSNRMTYSMFDIPFIYNTSLNQTRKEISTFLMSLHQLPEGCISTLFAPAEWPWSSIIGQRASGPSPPSVASLTPLGLKITSSTPESIPLTTWQIQPLLPVPTQSLDKWNIIIFYILNRPPTA